MSSRSSRLSKGDNDKMVRLYNGDCLEVMDSLIEEGIKVD